MRSSFCTIQSEDGFIAVAAILNIKQSANFLNSFMHPYYFYVFIYIILYHGAKQHSPWIFLSVDGSAPLLRFFF